ncbi:sigma-54-dependent transcriptional regulator [Paradevosia shaoguanensis]|uniref:Sigma-54 dependent transcriptional regulator n=1 Tax=Paradevosia shaoguanensis TaxID=1335043 RepID=A0AA41QLS5_9HYPH|nr:sigma-54 dependent transcriptional regulator [Paradevosia shaoguanensis]KFL25994.1 ATPase AAA [Devosia sp. 17-2-E-8]QMV02179.1 response regulator [Devosia sp. D6-9]CDP54172.1 Nitrogen regulation protein NtrX [Devosia sp. DBB001]MCF1742451.1 sigma-54 dependent transcriptional regulator [Paradevosia shaoguanensis]MCI0126934.1 sigma-54 dependent transcriptional regulator [Paradevosia shaoguanensis]
MALDILIIDDEDDIRDLIAGILEDEGYETRQAHDADSGLNEIARRRPSLVFLDIWMQGSRLDGLQLLDVLQSQHPDMPVVMISGHGNVETAVSAIKRGAYDYIEKPFKIDRLLLITQRAVEATRLRNEVAELKERGAGTNTDMVGHSPALQQVKGIIDKSAPTNSRIFVAGPSGAGKGLVARLIHQRSPRAQAPFIEINASLYAPDEVPVVLFGRETREKTGILRTEVGALERAHGGTLYLSEVTALPPSAQAALLRTLVENKFNRVGGQVAVPIDVRIISSSSLNIPTLVEAGQFRSDLYHRLSIVPVQLTPLKERREDVPPLVNVFIEQICRMHNLQRMSIGDDAMAVLQAQDWPGNARQLRNSIERLLILMKGQAPEDGMITAAMLPSDIGEVLPTVGDTDASAHLMSLPLRDAREVFERQYLLAQIERFGGNISKTAEFVGMERSALHRKIKSLGL